MIAGNKRRTVVYGHAQSFNGQGDVTFNVYYIGHDCPHCHLSLGVTERAHQVYYQCGICGYSRETIPADLLTADEHATLTHSSV